MRTPVHNHRIGAKPVPTPRGVITHGGTSYVAFIKGGKTTTMSLAEYLASAGLPVRR